MRDATARRLSTLHTTLYRLTDGRIGKRLVDNDMLLLTTTGRRTGRPHTVPLLAIDHPEGKLVIASWGGRPDHPEWFKNLLAEPRVEVQWRGERYTAFARVLDPEDKERWWPEVTAAYDGYVTYQQRTDRDIPLVVLRRISD